MFISQDGLLQQKDNPVLSQLRPLAKIFYEISHQKLFTLMDHLQEIVFPSDNAPHVVVGWLMALPSRPY
jgi:hypothetical protein